MVARPMTYTVTQYRPAACDPFSYVNEVVRGIEYDDITAVPFIAKFDHGDGKFDQFEIEPNFSGELIISAKYKNGSSWVAGIAREEKKQEEPMTHVKPRALQTCANCSAFAPNPESKVDPQQGWCRAGPPQMFQTMAPVQGSRLSPNGAQMVPVFQGMWPPTNTSAWCRSWEDDEK